MLETISCRLYGTLIEDPVETGVITACQRVASQGAKMCNPLPGWGVTTVVWGLTASQTFQFLPCQRGLELL